VYYENGIPSLYPGSLGDETGKKLHSIISALEGRRGRWKEFQSFEESPGTGSLDKKG
jgi:hypothetical protein